MLVANIHWIGPLRDSSSLILFLQYSWQVNKNTDDWIRTEYLNIWKRRLYQLCHNKHCSAPCLYYLIIFDSVEKYLLRNTKKREYKSASESFLP